MADTLRDLTNGTIRPPIATLFTKASARLLTSSTYSRAADHVGVTMPEWSPVLPAICSPFAI